MAFAHLLEPGDVGRVRLRNRVMWASHATNFAGTGGEVSDEQVHYAARRARGGVAMVVSELVQAATEIDGLRVTHRSLRADDPRFVAGLARIAREVHRHGAAVGVQMSPGAGAQALGGPWRDERGLRAASPSGVVALGHHEHAMDPRALTVGEIQRIVELCGESARRLAEAGFDLIELHAHGGYLIHQFLSPYFNKRTDGYGGSVENRCRFLLEIVAATRAGAGPDVAISVKWSVQDSLPDGWDVPQSLQLVRMLRTADVDALGASSGVHGGQYPAAPPYFYPMGTFLPFVDQVRGAASMPLYTSGRLDDPELCEKLLRERRLDFVQVCRGLIADPDWVRKIAEGRVESIRPCLACNHCRDELVRRRPIRCSVNATCGRERDEDAGTRAAVAKSVLVVGGGPAGLETARIAARRGHRVTLFERTGKLGGMLAVGGVHNPRIEEFRRWLVADVESQGVELRLRTEVTPERVEALAAEHVVLATGGAPARLDVPGSDRDNVYSLSDFLGLMRDGVLRKGALMRLAAPLARRLLTPALLRRLLAAPIPLRSPLVIIGGQFAGCSLALLLAHLGRQLTLIESSAGWGTTLESNTRVGLEREVSAGRVRVLTSAQAVEIVAAGVVVSIAGAEQRMVEAATVIVAPDPERGDGELGRALAARVNVRTVGDAGGFGRIPNAIAEGHAAACAVA